MHRDLADQRLEIVGARDEIRFAVDLDQHADLTTLVYVVPDQALCGRAAGALCRLGLSARPEDRHCLLDVAFGLGQRRLTFHEASAGYVSELFYLCCADGHASHSSQSYPVTTQRL